MIQNGDSLDPAGARFSRRRLLQGALGAGAAFSLADVLAACGGSDERSEAGTGQTTGGETGAGSTIGEAQVKGGRLRIGFTAGNNEVVYLPSASPYLIDFARSWQVYDELTRRAIEPDAPPLPGLAESWEPNQDHTIWTVKLRSGVTFHNGKPFTAKDVLYTFQFNLDKANGFAYGQNLLENLDLEKTKIIDDHTIAIAQKRPSADGFEPDVAILAEGFQKADLKTAPIGTGPFKFVSFKPGDRSLFERNESYWLEGKPYVDEIEIISFADPAAKLNALLAGQIDVLDAIQPGQAKAQQNNPNVKILQAKGAMNSAPQFTLRVDQKPFDDVNVRTAMKLAVNRQEMVDRLLLGFGSRTISSTAPRARTTTPSSRSGSTTPSRRSHSSSRPATTASTSSS